MIGTVCSNYRHRCSFKSEHNWEGLCDHLKTRRIFTFNICISTSMLLGLIMCVNRKRSPDETNFNRIQPSNPIVVLDVGFTYLPLGRERGKMVIIIIAYLSREVSYYYYTTHPWMGKRERALCLSWTLRTIPFYYGHSLAHVGPWVYVRWKSAKERASEWWVPRSSC